MGGRTNPSVVEEKKKLMTGSLENLWFPTQLETPSSVHYFNQLNNQNQLEKFFTTIGAGEGANPLIKSFCNEKRQYAIPDKMISRQWMPEFARLLSKGDQAKKRHRTDHSYQALDKKVSNKLTILLQSFACI